ncbi:hypothetical protein N481_19925 [Pseudoalteromonas luteoviolacea S4047-1]|uniref:Uncharacterized protein n=1 Tax=Pseudoalteromonas luteoviolacea S4054 TaxID=1129367 RepID=A0A0F6AHK6_9GAMM|nr:hypothetical protein N479_26145 [Pseudoalteromonas luteoviolacea S4054]KZN71068.1 hypothetical protein N481_19925 [Pseudoalteromonas luteoviolacea S4047-1]
MIFFHYKDEKYELKDQKQLFSQANIHTAKNQKPIKNKKSLALK